MTVQLPAELEDLVRAAALSGGYASEDALVAEVLREHLRRVAPPTVEETNPALPPDPSSRQSLWERIEELQKTVPEEEWANLPVDGAEQHDHYIYGWPKRLTP